MTQAEARCCSDFYAQDWVQQLADGSFHPGDTDLTLRTVAGMQLPPGAAVLDVGCGTGKTTRLLAQSLGLCATAVDMSERNVAAAAALSATAESRFICGTAHALPFADSSFDGVICECVLSLFPDKRAALSEIWRVIRPDGRVGITDMAREGELPEDIARVAAPWTCIANAPAPDAWEKLFRSQGLVVIERGDASAALGELVSKLKRRLLMLGARSLATGTEPVLDIGAIRYWLDRFGSLVASGAIRYLVFQLERASGAPPG